MEPCRGFEDWLECLNCPHLCMESCPIEGKDAIEKMKLKMRVSTFPEINETKKHFEIN